MGFRKRRGRRRNTVRWLVDNSAFSQMTRLSHTAPGQIHAAQFPLLPEGTQAGSLAQEGQVAGIGLSNFSRTEDDSLIIDHIGGKLTWSWENNDGGEGHQDAGGTWLHFIRAAIVISPRQKTVSGGAPGAVASMNAGGTDFSLASQVLDVGNDFDILQQGSNLPDGLRILWRRNWSFVVDWSYGYSVSGGPLNSERVCPPGPYIDIKPKRLLRANDVLQLMIFTQTVNAFGADGTVACWVGQDLRVAAHNTARRR